jgi:hemin uptake protein HemP
LKFLRRENGMQAKPAKPKPVRKIAISDLLEGRREAVLLHDGAEYRLRLTSNGKLILTKLRRGQTKVRWTFVPTNDSKPSDKPRTKPAP